MLTCQRCQTDFTKEDQKNENIQLDFNGASGVEPAHLECPEPPKDTYEFKYYLHEDDMYEQADWIAEQNDLPLAVAEAICESRPFYEVTVECEYDTKTGKTKILKAY